MKCKNCGSSVPKGFVFCGKCGAPIEEDEKEIKYKVEEQAPYVHDSDKVALKALFGVPGFSKIWKLFMKIWDEKQFKIQNMSSKVKISEKQLSEYYDMLLPICARLRIAVPEMYLEMSPEPNAYTYGDTSPFIVLTSGLLETIPHELIPTVIAHECGHIDCRHTLFTTMSGTLLRAIELIGIPGLLTVPLEMAFYYWERCSEFSADRAAILCDNTYEKMAQVCMCLAGYDKDIIYSASLETFMEQANEYKELVSDSKWNKTLEFMQLRYLSHPLLAVRAYEAREWVKTDQYKTLSAGLV